MNKKIKLLIIPVFSFIFSCVANQNTLISKPSATIGSQITNPSMIVSPSISITPSVIITSTPSAIPSESGNPTIQPVSHNIKDLVLYYSEDNSNLELSRAITRSTYHFGNYDYNNTPNQKDVFHVKIIFDDDTKSDNPDKLVWISSDESIVTINNGVLTTIKPGTAYITVYSQLDKSKAASLYINVLDSLFYESPINCSETGEKDILKRDKFARNSSISYDISERLRVVSGKVYDPNNVPVEGATVTARDIEGYGWIGEAQITVGGGYVFRNAPVCTKINITITKDGWTTRNRVLFTKSNLNGDPTANVVDFSGVNAIQDEPEITNLKVNGQDVLGAVSGDSFVDNSPTVRKYNDISQITSSIYNPLLTGVDSDSLTVDMTFSEPVRHDDVENYFRIQSQILEENNNKPIIIDQNSPEATFTWSSDDKFVSFKTNKPVLTNKEGNEARYAIDFTQAFRDKTDKAAKPKRYFRFSQTQINDFAVFSVKNGSY